MAIINPPPQSPVDQLQAERGIPFLVNVTEGWRNFFQSVFTICNSLTESGITVNRPTRILWTGRTYFDTTLNLPIWYDGSAWIKADGTPA